MPITISRVTLTGDTPTGVSDKITINETTTQDGKTEAVVIDGEVQIVSADGLAENQTANQDLSNLQPLGKNEKLYVVPLKIYRMKGNSDDGNNAIISKIETWDEEDKDNDTWPEGRFSIIFDDCVPLSRQAQKPAGDIRGLMLHKVDWKLSWIGNPPYAKAILYFKESRGDGT
jgi:hypothetical protein